MPGNVKELVKCKEERMTEDQQLIEVLRGLLNKPVKGGFSILREAITNPNNYPYKDGEVYYRLGGKWLPVKTTKDDTYTQYKYCGHSVNDYCRCKDRNRDRLRSNTVQLNNIVVELKKIVEMPACQPFRGTGRHATDIITDTINGLSIAKGLKKIR